MTDYKVRLDIFEGPLDLLIYLIQKNELDIHDIPIGFITEQYLAYIEMMETLNLDIAGEFLVYASMLMRIKSKMLLPKDEQAGGEVLAEEDPRDELVRKLIEYMRFKDAAQQLRGLEEIRSASFMRFPGEPDFDLTDTPFLDVPLFDLISAFNRVLKEMPQEVFHQVIRDEFTVAEKVHEILRQVSVVDTLRFASLFGKARNKMEAITIFLALLELIRLKEICIAQDESFGDIEIKKNVDRESRAMAKEPAAPESDAPVKSEGEAGG